MTFLIGLGWIVVVVTVVMFFYNARDDGRDS